MAFWLAYRYKSKEKRICFTTKEINIIYSFINIINGQC